MKVTCDLPSDVACAESDAPLVVGAGGSCEAGGGEVTGSASEDIVTR